MTLPFPICNLQFTPLYSLQTFPESVSKINSCLLLIQNKLSVFLWVSLFSSWEWGEERRNCLVGMVWELDRLEPMGELTTEFDLWGALQKWELALLVADVYLTSRAFSVLGSSILVMSQKERQSLGGLFWLFYLMWYPGVLLSQHPMDRESEAHRLWSQKADPGSTSFQPNLLTSYWLSALICWTKVLIVPVSWSLVRVKWVHVSKLLSTVSGTNCMLSVYSFYDHNHSTHCFLKLPCSVIIL